MKGRRHTSVGGQEGIPSRLAELRRIFAFSQQEMAEKANIERPRWATYEYGRHPLPAIVGFTLCRSLNISEYWIVTGRGYFRPSFAQGRSLGFILAQIKPSETFESAFRRILLPDNDFDYSIQTREAFWGFVEKGHDEEAKRFLRFFADELIRRFPKNELPSLASFLVDQTVEYAKERKISVSLFSTQDDAEPKA